MLSTIATLAAQSSGTLAGSAGTRRLLGGGGHSWDHFECDCSWRSKYACPLDELFLTKIDRSGDGHIDRHEAIDLNADGFLTSTELAAARHGQRRTVNQARGHPRSLARRHRRLRDRRRLGVLHVLLPDPLTAAIAAAAVACAAAIAAADRLVLDLAGCCPARRRRRTAVSPSLPPRRGGGDAAPLPGACSARSRSDCGARPLRHEECARGEHALGP